MNRTAADIARAYAKFATQATGELLRLGAEAAGASAACLYWRVREQVIAVPAGPAATPEQVALRKQVRREFWPWVQSQNAPRGRVLLVPRSAGSATVPTGQDVILLTLQNHAGELGGIIALQASATQCADILGPWCEEAIGFADLVRQNLLADLDRDTGLLTPASFDAEIQRWRDSAGERDARGCLLHLHLGHLDGIAQALGGDIQLKALQEVLGLIETRLRSRDVVARLGPACVGVLLKQCNQTDARRVCAALEDRLRDYRFRSGCRQFDTLLRITVRVLDPLASDDVGPELLTVPVTGVASETQSVPAIAPVSIETGLVPPVHSARVLRFPARIAPASSAAPDGLLDHFTTLPLRAQPCRLLVSPERTVLYRLRSMMPNQSGRLIEAASSPAMPADPAVGHHADDLKARNQIFGILDQIASVAAAAAEHASARVPALDAALLLPLNARLIDDSSVSWLTDACRLRQVPHSLLCLSVSEAAIFADVRRLLPVLGRLRRVGFQLCVETGRGGIESAALLRRLRIDYLHAFKSPGRSAIETSAVCALLLDQVAFAEAHGARVICGGADSPARCRQLLKLGVHIGYGRELGASMSLSRVRNAL